jgi:hypothetical protein
MPAYRTEGKSRTQFAYEDARDEARAQVRRFVRRWTDDVYLAIDALFIEAENSDQEVVSVEGLNVAELLRQAVEATPELGAGDAC